MSDGVSREDSFYFSGLFEGFIAKHNNEILRWHLSRLSLILKALITFLAIPLADPHALTMGPLEEILILRRQGVFLSFGSTILRNLSTSIYFDFNKILETMTVE